VTDYLICNGWLASPGNHDIIVHRGWLTLAADRIELVGTDLVPDGIRHRAKSIIDATGCLITPGLVNAHTHLSQTFMRGLAPDKSLLMWLRQAIQPIQAAMTPDDMYLASLLGIVENIRSGVTTIFQHHKITATRSHVEATLHAARASGARMLLARGWRDTGPRGEAPDRIVEEMRYLARSWDGQSNGRIHIGFGPMSPMSCSIAALRQMLALAQEYGFPTHIHVSETTDEVHSVQAQTGYRPIEWLKTSGALRPMTQLVHCVHLDDRELDLVAASGATVVHCPVSNMRLASGLARVQSMLDKGICLCLGTDGSGSNDTQDMLETIKTAALVANVERGKPSGITADTLLKMATEAGAAAFGCPDIGRLHPGMKADVSVFDMRSTQCWPINDPLQSFIFASNGASARDVWIDGVRVLSNGSIGTLDEKTLFERCETAAKALFSRAGVARQTSSPEPDVTQSAFAF
jgi:5-methylthioadenosine/S-adenosylhomocysteine deaminase